MNLELDDWVYNCQTCGESWEEYGAEPTTDLCSSCGSSDLMVLNIPIDEDRGNVYADE